MPINVSEDGSRVTVIAKCGCSAEFPDQFKPCQQHKHPPDKALDVACQEWVEHKERMLGWADRAQCGRSNVHPTLHEMTKKKQYPDESY